MSDTILTPPILYAAYSQGYFPMPDDKTGDILWYRPDPRAIMPLDGLHVSRSLRQRLRRGDFTITFNQDFMRVVDECAARRVTWITPEFKSAYSELFRLKRAHSVEVWYQGDLAGGCYGVAFGGAFFAESMFHRVTDGSKVAIYHLVQRLKERNFTLLECQFLTAHLKRLGAIEIPDSEYMVLLNQALQIDTSF